MKYKVGDKVRIVSNWEKVVMRIQTARWINGSEKL